jgi:hypothetical protein
MVSLLGVRTPEEGPALMIFMLPRTLASRPPAWTNDSQTCHPLDSIEWSYTERTNVKVFVMNQLTISILIDFPEFVGGRREVGTGPNRSTACPPPIFSTSTRLIPQNHHPQHDLDTVSVHFTPKLTASTVHSPRTRAFTGIRKLSD